MDPATLGLVAAGLVAKRGIESAGEEAGESAWGTLGRIADRLRNWFGDRGDEAGLEALDLVEKAPDSARRVEALAACIGAAARSDSDSAIDLALLLDAIRAQARPEVASFVDDIRSGTRSGGLSLE